MNVRRGWNPKRLGIVHSNGPGHHETELWLYLTGRILDIVVQVSEDGIVKGHTVHRVKLPPLAKTP